MRELLLKLLNQATRPPEGWHTHGEGDKEIWELRVHGDPQVYLYVAFTKARIILKNSEQNQWYIPHPQTEKDVIKVAAFINTTKR
ncbi:hypothetical protein [Vibrio phage V-YDF132]|nr:hypothetical protein [Vibrio phage V-YDF132]